MSIKRKKKKEKEKDRGVVVIVNEVNNNPSSTL